MLKTFTDTADFDINAVIHFFKARNLKPIKIYLEVKDICGEVTMRDGIVRNWVRISIEAQTNVYYEAWSGKPFAIKNDQVKKTWKKLMWEDV